MNKETKVFIATPISGFNNQSIYNRYRTNILKLIDILYKMNFKVISEIERINEIGCYDSPNKSVKNDFNNIKECGYFIIVHPYKMQTSSLIELGYACALEKKIIIIANKNDLPYLALGFEDYSSSIKIINIDSINEIDYDLVIKILYSL